MHILKLIIGLCAVIALQNSFASTEESVPIYVTNNTSHSVHIIKSLYSVTPFTIKTDVIQPYSGKVEIGTATFSDKKDIHIAFFMPFVGEEQTKNNPLVVYQVEPHKEGLTVYELINCINNRLDTCFIVNFPLFLTTPELEVMPFQFPSKENILNQFKATWGRDPNVKIDYDDKNNKISITRKVKQ